MIKVYTNQNRLNLRVKIKSKKSKRFDFFLQRLLLIVFIFLQEFDTIQSVKINLNNNIMPQSKIKERVENLKADKLTLTLNSISTTISPFSQLEDETKDLHKVSEEIKQKEINLIDFQLKKTLKKRQINNVFPNNNCILNDNSKSCLNRRKSEIHVNTPKNELNLVYEENENDDEDFNEFPDKENQIEYLNTIMKFLHQSGYILETNPITRPSQSFSSPFNLANQQINIHNKNVNNLQQKKKRKHREKKRIQRAFGKSEFLLPENFGSFRRKEIPVTYRLHDDLLRYYRKGTRPVTHPNKIVSVTMSVFLYQIIKLDAVKNTISLSGSFELYWQDEFLQWTPDSYEDATEIFLSSDDIWIPEFSLYYSLNFNDAVKLISNNDVRLNYTGHVRYYLPFSTESLCNSVDVKFFPFDIQQCTLLFGSWAHSNDSIKYSLYSENLSLIDYYDNQEWQLDLTRSHIMSNGFLYDYLDPPLFWEMIVIDLVVTRQSFYYVFNLVIPSAIITLVAVIGFHTPSTSGRVRDAKFRLGIMTLMSMSMILLAIVEDMPKFSLSGSRKGRGSFSGIPLIGLYYFMLLAIVGLSTVTTSMFVFVERNMRRNQKFPWYLRPFAFDFDVDMPVVQATSFNSSRQQSTNGVVNKKRKIFDGVKSKSLFSFKMSSTDDLAATEALLSSTNSGGVTGQENDRKHSLLNHDPSNGFLSKTGDGQSHQSTSFDVFSKQAGSIESCPQSQSSQLYAQSTALSLFKLLPKQLESQLKSQNNISISNESTNTVPRRRLSSKPNNLTFSSNRQVRSSVDGLSTVLLSKNITGVAPNASPDECYSSTLVNEYPHHYQDVFCNPAVLDVKHTNSIQVLKPGSVNQKTSSLSTLLRRKRTSLTENFLIYECLHQLLETLILNMMRIEKAVRGVRHDIKNLSLSTDLENLNIKWELAIRRFELLSLVLYISILFATMFLFFYHDWYCSIGHNPCGQPNLKCSWMKSDTTNPSCKG